MQAKAAVATLSEVLSDASDDPIVRHEVSSLLAGTLHLALKVLNTEHFLC